MLLETDARILAFELRPSLTLAFFPPFPSSLANISSFARRYITCAA